MRWMPPPLWTGLLTLLLTLPAQGRIGDTEEQLLMRLQGSGMGRAFPGLRTMDERQREQILRESPLQAVQQLLPEGDEFTRELFWKNADRGASGRDNGWRLHAYFLRGRSVAEVYRRVGASLNEAEVRALLATFRGEQIWRRVEPRDRSPSVLGYDFELGDASAPLLRARRQGDVLLVFDRRLDDLLLERRAALEERQRAERSRREAEQDQAAPVSVEGF